MAWDSTFVTASALLAATAIGCSKAPRPDAYGNVEATEVVVSAQATGQLTTFSVDEGQALAAGAIVGTVDATELTLQRGQLDAQRQSNVSRVAEAASQVQSLIAERDAAQAQHDAAVAQRDGLQAQLEIAQRARERTSRLFALQAATSQQLDQAERDDRVLQQQIAAQDRQIAAQARQVAAHTAQIAAARAQGRTARTQVAAAEAQVAQVSDRIRKADVVNPSAGTVLVTYVKRGEIVQPGQPLYKVADLGAVDVRAYVTEPQLGTIRLGQPAHVSADAGPGRHTLDGAVSWVSSKAEFTPTPIQTRDERADLVYAVKIRVPNRNGVLKIGMPVDVEFAR
jgi:HlyD family secretion protein